MNSVQPPRSGRSTEAYVQRDPGALREGYSRAVRRFEIVSIGGYAAAMGWLLVRLTPGASAHPALTAAALLAGYLLADLVSGVVHWLADTWGTPDWPLVGKALIRPFREHHVDQKEITRHDFIETNGNNCFISIAPTLAGVALARGGTLAFSAAALLFSLSLWIFGTNQFHKWAHMDAPPRLVALLQRAHLVLPPAHHVLHHTAPYAKHYCITVGWMNEPLHRLGVFRLLERAITGITGLIPREDDIGRRAAEALAGAPLAVPRLSLSELGLGELPPRAALEPSDE